MSTVPIREQHSVEVGGDTYMLTALTTSAGFETMAKLQEMETAGTLIPDPLFLRKLIMESASVNNVAFDVNRYERHFSRKHANALKLFQEIIQFNFPELTQDPNADSDTSEAQ